MHRFFRESNTHQKIENSGERGVRARGEGRKGRRSRGRESSDTFGREIKWRANKRRSGVSGGEGLKLPYGTGGVSWWHSLAFPGAHINLQRRKNI